MFEEYFREPMADKRKEILDQITVEEVGQDWLDQLHTLFDLRYKPDGKGGYADHFLRAFFDLKQASEDADSTFGYKRNRRKVLAALSTLCLDRVGNGEGEYARDILYREMCHLTAFYISTCQVDHNYNAVIWGVGHVNDERTRKRLTLDLDRIGEALPRYLDLEDEYVLMKEAVTAMRDRMV